MRVHDISSIALRRPQTKLTVGEPGDRYEQEADRVANRGYVNAQYCCATGNRTTRTNSRRGNKNQTFIGKH